MKHLIRMFSGLYGLAAVFFVAVALLLVAIAVMTAWSALSDGLTPNAAQDIIEAIGLMAIAVMALQIAQTIVEEEVVRDAHISAPTRVRRYLSRFMVVVVVAIAIEGLVATVKALHENIAHLPHAASTLIGAAVLLACWGWFIQLNRAAEELEPEAMQQAKSEDRKLEG
ncbi:hypothetical protein SAMN06265795_102260 [Noviherbaspirillum humi]|uniref:Uncharacterized protein n=1 Tax=Noviherbaspirillum humi TaxID=1688639 RepID=A0A239DP55_9BURK|nr:hypothetical protein [Noviherbaspirillum humi]SNS33404.1 hypothetical protein SAMN06265795_102260 [Noviherbaspirillum humi]